MRWAAYLLLAGSLVLALPAPLGALQRQGSALQVWLACDTHRTALEFPLVAVPGGDLQPQPPASTAFDMTHPEVGATCQAVLEDLSAADQPFIVPDGTATFQVEGPAYIAESATSSFTTSCNAASSGGCVGAIAGVPDAAGDMTVSGTPALTVHLGLQPGTSIPRGGVPGAVTVRVLFDGDRQSVEAGVSLDIAPPQYRLDVSPQTDTLGSGVQYSTGLNLQISHPVPSGCSGVAGGPLLACDDADSPMFAAGAEPGEIDLATTLGTLSSGSSRVGQPCGGPAAPAGNVLVPAVGQLVAFARTCAGASDRLTSDGRSGDAIVSARFTGAVTGAFAFAATHISVVPVLDKFPLRPGCTQFTAPSQLPPDSAASVLVESTEPPEAVVAIWRRDPQSRLLQAVYLRDQQAPLDVGTVQPGDSVFICVDRSAAYPLPTGSPS